MLHLEQTFGAGRRLGGPMGLAIQRSFEDLGARLVDAEFCVFDLETTGGSPADSRITEIGAVKVRGGEVIGEFQSLVNPHQPIPPFIAMLTGITDTMVATAPPLASLVPALIEFIGDSTLVAHNASFDTRFLRASMVALGYEPLGNPVVCTVRLARRLVRDEVPNLRLETLARAMRSRFEPTHRALDDARATTDVFHALLELAGRFGVSHLDDLLWFQGVRGHASFSKMHLAEALPRSRGVYLFADDTGRILYVGKAANLRERVRSYFSSDDRRKTADLLREMTRIEHLSCATDLDASVLEARLVRRHAPPYNRALRGRRAHWYLRLSRERYPRLVSSRTGGFLGPLGAGAIAAVREALEEAAPIRTCSDRLGPRASVPICALGQIGRCPAPCERPVDPGDYASGVEPVARALAGDPSAAVEALAKRMERLSAQARYEEAAATRERLGALVGAARASRGIGALERAGALAVAIDGHRIEVREGSVAAVDGVALPSPPDGHPDEARLVSGWLARNAERARLLWCDGEYALPLCGGLETARWSERLRRLNLVGDRRRPAPAKPAVEPSSRPG